MKYFERMRGLVAVVAVMGTLAAASMDIQAAVGRAVVTAVRGSADATDGSGSWKALKAGAILSSGTVIRTAGSSEVDLFLGQNGPTVRLKENTQLGLDRLNYDQTGVETVVETSLDLRSGRILGRVSKLSSSSKYEIKTPRGVAGIRGTEYDISADNVVTVVEGQVVLVHITNNIPASFVVNAGQTFDPNVNQVIQAPEADIRALGREINGITAIIPPTTQPLQDENLFPDQEDLNNNALSPISKRASSEPGYEIPNDDL